MRWSLAPDERPAVLGDLEEEFALIAAERGELAARRWYLRQVLTSVVPNAVRRARRRYCSDEARSARRTSRVSAAVFAVLGIIVGAIGMLLTPDGWVAGAGVMAMSLLLLVDGVVRTRQSQPRPRAERLSVTSALVLAAIIDKMGHSRVALAVILGANFWIYWPPRLRPRWLGGRREIVLTRPGREP
jgi:hypothetical protein